jgi:hypothetical protein
MLDECVLFLIDYLRLKPNTTVLLYVPFKELIPKAYKLACLVLQNTFIVITSFNKQTSPLQEESKQKLHRTIGFGMKLILLFDCVCIENS